MAASSRRLRLVLGGVAASVATAATVVSAAAQGVALSRGLALESSGDHGQAVVAFREAMREGAPFPALVALERSFSALGWADSVLPIADSLAREYPREIVVRTVQLRTLRRVGRSDDATAVFRAWVRASPRDVAPFREYARILLEAGDVTAADEVLRDAAIALGATRALALEGAQVRVALGEWGSAAVAWRDAMGGQPYLESAVIYSLRSTPPESRAAVRAVFLEAPVTLPVRRTLAALELAWGRGNDAWAALRDVPVTELVIDAWEQFAEDATRRELFGAARDATLALHAHRPSAARALRGAEAALAAGDAAAALSLAELALASGDSSVAPRAVPLRITALATLGRAREAERALTAATPTLAPTLLAPLRAAVAWAWVRSGDVTAAQRSLAGTTLAPDDPLAGWLALFDGDLARARTGLRRAPATDADALLALSILVRTEQAQSAPLGAAFRALARRDTSAARRGFVLAASTVPEAAPVLLVTAARLAAAGGATRDAMTLWAQVVAEHPSSPEAAESELEWARVLRRAGDAATAIARLEHLILTHPTSALLPQARRELDVARGRIPPEADDV
jgi:tetratricopeptide (TPR) repeat protein